MDEMDEERKTRRSCELPSLTNSNASSSSATVLRAGDPSNGAGTGGGEGSGEVLNALRRESHNALHGELEMP